MAWLNETSAYVGLHKRDQAAVALSTLSQSDTYSIMTYSRRQSEIRGAKMLTPSPAPSNRRKRSMDSAPRCNKKIKTDAFSQ